MVATLDAETDPFEYRITPRPFVWGLYIVDTEEYHEFWDDHLEFQHETCTNKLIDFLDKWEGPPLRIYAHNGGKFDYFFIIRHLNPQLSLINGRIAECGIGDHILRDSWLILPLPLGAMDKGEIDYDKMKLGRRHKHVKEISVYLYKDCVFLAKWVSAFISRFGMKLTLPSASFSEIKKTGYRIGKTFIDYDDTFRPFYYGGRVQCFSAGEHIGKFIFVDINSAYPRAMVEDHPSGPEFMKVFRLPEDYGGYFAEIVAISKGALPYRSESDPTKKLYFPDDDRARVYRVTGWEIMAGLETGTLEIVNVNYAYVIKDRQNFKEFIEKYYNEKLQAGIDGDDEAYLFAKLIQNAGYGKFGMDGRDFKDYLVLEEGEKAPLVYDDDGELSDKQWQPYTQVDTGEMIFEKDNPKMEFYDVATAASITGWVRAYLWRAICASENPLYCDTDSIICKEFHGVIGDQLGEWSVDAHLEAAYIAQRKMYAVKKTDGTWKYACKGIPKNKVDAQAIVKGVTSRENIVVEKDAPSFSLKYGARFMAREIDFKNLEKNLHNNPD